MENFPALKTLDWIFVLKIANIWMDCSASQIGNVNITVVLIGQQWDSDTTSMFYSHSR